MPRGPLYEIGYRPRFSGHETFPLRYGWLKKSFDAVRGSAPGTDNRWVFNRTNAIARFGVGKNMVGSMRHWAVCARILEEQDDPDRIIPTQLGWLLFKDSGLDPYMEHPTTSWLIHWQLAGRPTKTTWYWTFNHFADLTFEREQLVQSLIRLASDRRWPRAAESTIRKDVSCLVRTYVGHSPDVLASREESLESPLTELGLVRQLGRRDGYQLVRGPKPTLGLGAFFYGVSSFWQDQFENVNTISFESIAFAPGSPGKVFLLDENELVEMMIRLEDATSGLYAWTEAAGLKQLSRRRKVTSAETLRFLKCDYAPLVDGWSEK